MEVFESEEARTGVVVSCIAGMCAHLCVGGIELKINCDASCIVCRGFYVSRLGCGVLTLVGCLLQPVRRGKEA